MENSPKDGLPQGWRESAASWAAGKERVHELHLFGSRAKGGHHEGSDVDIAYLLTGDEPGEKLAYSLWECPGWEAELSEVLGLPVDLQFTDDAGGLKVWTWVCEHGQLIYRKAVQLPVEERSSNDR